MTESTPTMDDLYPDGRGWHAAHGPYMSAVATALAAAGFPNDGGNAEPNDPRDGFIGLDVESLRVADDNQIWVNDEVGVCWQEERGWWLLTVAQSASNDHRFVYDLHVATIASPATVALATAEQVGRTIEIPADGHPDHDFTAHEFDDGDVEFELALRHYAEQS